MAVATEVVARFTADIGDVQSKMRLASSAFGAVGDAATFSSKRIREVGQAMSDAGAKMTVGLTLPLGGLAAAATNAAMSFETGMTKIIGLVGIASDEVANMGEKVLQMSGAVGKAPDELADGLFVVTSAGLRGSEAMSALGFSAKAGAAGLGETNDIARAVSGALSAYGSDVLSAADATDAIVATARAGNFETSQFAAAIGRVLPFAQQAGASFQEMGGAVALLTRVNGDAAQSVTQIQALFRAFVVPTEEAKTALAEMGMSAQDLRDSIAKDGLPETLAMLDKALGGNREQLGRILGSSEAASAAFQILEADAGTIAETFGVVAKSSGMTNEAFAAVAATTQFQVNQTMAQLKATLIDLGNQFLPIVKSVMDFARAHLSAFNSLPGPVKTMITVMGAFLAAIGPLLFIVGKLIVVFSTLLSLMLKTRAVGAMRAAFMGLRGDLAASRASMKQTQTSIGMLGTAAQMARVTISASFRAIAAAAKGLLASIGPVGLAFIALGIAFEVVIGKSAEAEAKALEYADALDAVTGAATRASEELILTNLLSQELGGIWSTVGTGFLGKDPIGFKELSDRAGLTLFNITKAVQGTRDEYDALIATIYEAVDAQRLTGAEGEMLVQTLDKERLGIENVRRAREIEAQAALEARDAYMKSAAAHTQYRDAAVRSHDANQAVADSFDTAGFAAEQAAEEIAFMRAELELWTGTASAIAAVDRAAESMENIGEAAVKFGTDLMGQTPKAREFRSAVLQAYNDSADAAASMSDKVSEQRAAFTGELIKMVASLRASGVKDRDIRAFLGAMEELPASVSDIMRATGVAIGKADFKDPIEKAFQKSVKSGTPMTADAMAEMARGASEAAREELGLTLEPELASVIKSGTTALRPTAFNNGELTGKSMGSGLSTGILRSSPVVEAAIRRVIQNAHAAAKAEAESTSPSELFARTGDDISNGIAVGVTRSSKKVNEAGRALVQNLMRAVNAALAPAMGPIQSAIADIFGNIPSVREAERAVQDASWAVADARDAVAEAEKRLAEARKEGKQREIAAAERDLARAKRDATDAAKALAAAQKTLDLSKYIAQNREAVRALGQLGKKFDYIIAKMEEVSGALESLQELAAKPFGTTSNIFKMFDSGALDIDSLARNATALIDTVTEAFGVLTDPKIVGAAAAEANRERLANTIGQITDLTNESIELRRKYEANLEALAKLEKDYQDEVKGINDTYDALEKAGQANLKALEDQLRDVNAAYERENSKLQSLIKERDDLLSNVSKGFRSFVNDFKGALTTGVRVIGQSTQKLADGITLTFDNIEETVSGGGIGASLRKRLDEIKAFAANVRTLVARGLDQSLIREFVEAGPAQAGDIVSALAVAGDDEIREINAIQGELAAQATEFGSYLSALWFDAGIAAQEAIVGPLEAQKAALESAIADAKAYLETLKAERQKALDEARAAYEEEKQRLEEDNVALLSRMDEIAAEIEGLIAELMATLPAESLQAGKDSMNALLDGFKERYPTVFNQLNGLMDALARSMERTVTITVRTVYEGAGTPPGRAMGGPVQARTAYLVGERGPEVFVPYSRGNIIPNHELGATPRMSIGTRNGGVVNVAEGAVQINVPGGMIGAPDKLEQYVSDAVERGLADLANEILAS